MIISGVDKMNVSVSSEIPGMCVNYFAQRVNVSHEKFVVTIDVGLMLVERPLL